MLEACITAPPDLCFDIFFATSRNRWGYRDLEHPRKVLGWEPLDAAEDHRQGSAPGGSRSCCELLR
jgi:hypothetical protein